MAQSMRLELRGAEQFALGEIIREKALFLMRRPLLLMKIRKLMLMPWVMVMGEKSLLGRINRPNLRDSFPQKAVYSEVMAALLKPLEKIS